MVIDAPPKVEVPRQTSPKQGGGWLGHFWQRVRMMLEGDDELLVVENRTKIGWYVYHNYSQLGIIDAGEEREFRLVKHGELSVRPVLDGEEIEYLILPLTVKVKRVFIYHRRIENEVEMYDMRAA